MDKLRTMTIVGTRPEIIRLSRIIAKLDAYTDHTLVHTGQNYDYELNEVFFRELGIRKPDLFLEAAGTNAADTIGRVIIASDRAMSGYTPEALLILGDTNSSLAAISAKRRKIPIFHMEAGNRCFDFRVPEEINRRIVDHTSDINLTYSDIARNYLLREGLPPDQIIKTGSPMREVIQHYAPQIRESKILKALNIEEGNYFIVSSHREENVDSADSLKKLLNILDALSKKYMLPVIMSTHPRTRKRLDDLGIKVDPLIIFHKPFGFFDYITLQINAKAVLSDSGTLTEESSILNFSAINLREVHERPEGFEEASVMFAGLDATRVLQCLEILKDQAKGPKRSVNMVKDYETTNVSEKILRIMQSYTDFVNRKVWGK
jgi:UDP-N-acetylglucosamine 2-epimerase (non-hydrolysing)